MRSVLFCTVAGLILAAGIVSGLDSTWAESIFVPPGQGRAIDGDTFTYRGERYRVRGIDTPEREQPGADAAQRRLQRDLDRGVTVDTKARDKYGRTIGNVRSREGNDVGRTMRSEGYNKMR